MVGFRNELGMTILTGEEKVQEGKDLLELLWKMGEVRRRWGEASGVGAVRTMSWIILGFAVVCLGCR